MIDITKSDTHVGEGAQQTETPTQPDLQTQPIEQPSKISFADLGTKITSIPTTISQSLDNGGGDDVIHAVQNIIKTVVMANFSSCRIISLRACLLSETEKNVVSKTVYAISFFLLVVFLITLLISFSWSTLLLGLECLGAGYIADRVIHISHVDLQGKHMRNRNVSSHKSKQSHCKDNDDDDYL